MKCQRVVGVAFLALATSASIAAEPGTQEAARDFVPVFLGTQFTIIDELVVSGDSANVRARLHDLECNMTLRRSNDLNEFGWTVARLDCA